MWYSRSSCSKNRLQGGKYTADPTSIASTHGIKVKVFVEIEHWLLDMMTVLSFLNDKLSAPISDEDLDRRVDAVLEMIEQSEKA
jgi:hypothetical protein